MSNSSHSTRDDSAPSPPNLPLPGPQPPQPPQPEDPGSNTSRCWHCRSIQKEKNIQNLLSCLQAHHDMLSRDVCWRMKFLKQNKNKRSASHHGRGHHVVVGHTSWCHHNVLGFPIASGDSQSRPIVSSPKVCFSPTGPTVFFSVKPLTGLQTFSDRPTIDHPNL